MSSGSPASRAIAYPEQVDRAVGAGDDESPLLEADVRFGRFKRLGGDPLALLDDYIGGAPDSSADSGFVVRS